jgi:hypothetical protein
VYLNGKTLQYIVYRGNRQNVHLFIQNHPGISWQEPELMQETARFRVAPEFPSVSARRTNPISLNHNKEPSKGSNTVSRVIRPTEEDAPGKGPFQSGVPSFFGS